MTSENSPRARAMIEFVGTFASLTGVPPENLSDLSDGVTLFEALSEIAPEFFDPTTIARHLGDNWALKSSNLRKLVRNLEDYFHETLQKDADFDRIPLTAVAKEGSPDGVASIVELVAAAAVTCQDKGTYVQRIMSMTPENQVEMKGILEGSLARLTDYADEDDEGQENELVFDDDDDDDKGLDGAPTNLFGGTHVNDGLEEELEEARREISTLKSQASVVAEDNQKAQSKLRAVVEDLQDRLVKRQDDVMQLEEDLRTATAELEDARAKLAEVNEIKTQLEDDLDVANAKAQQLHKAEATVLAYKKKLEGVGAMNQQMTDLEDQAANYLRQIMELENQVKKSNALQKAVQELEEKVKSLEKERDATVSSTGESASAIAELKTKLQAAESAKKMYEEELTEMRAQQESSGGTAEVTEGLSLAATTSVADREKMTRLKIENEQLKKEVDEMKSKIEATAAATTTAVAVAASTPAAVSGDDTPVVKAVPAEGSDAEVASLKAQLEAKNKEIAKISGDKDKLESYTKRTLAKFQEKYLVALQECKAKLKEKQDKIEALESRSASEKTAQKREERLLSSTIYELGLAMMQNRLKER